MLKKKMGCENDLKKEVTKGRKIVSNKSIAEKSWNETVSWQPGDQTD